MITPMEAEEQQLTGPRAKMHCATVHFPNGSSVQFRGEEVIAFDPPTKQLIIKAEGKRLTYYVGFPFVVELEPSMIAALPKGIIVPT